jgi:hypothetical protein
MHWFPTEHNYFLRSYRIGNKDNKNVIFYIKKTSGDYKKEKGNACKTSTYTTLVDKS